MECGEKWNVKHSLKNWYLTVIPSFLIFKILFMKYECES